MDIDDLRDLLDGEAEILDADGNYCFDHRIFVEDICIECESSKNTWEQRLWY